MDGDYTSWKKNEKDLDWIQDMDWILNSKSNGVFLEALRSYEILGSSIAERKDMTS